jgi:hypothetical protein
MASEDMGIKWNQFPIDHRPSLNIFWEYDVFYPMMQYLDSPANDSDTGDDEPPDDEEDLAEWHAYRFARLLRRSEEGLFIQQACLLIFMHVLD